MQIQHIFNTLTLFLAVFCFVAGPNQQTYSMVLPGPIPDPVEPVVTPGPLGAPVRIDCYTADTLLVSDYSSGTVYAVNKNDLADIQPLLQVSGQALAIGHLGKSILVGNASTGNVEFYSKHGRFKYIINNDGPIARPSDLAVDEKMKEIFVVDSRQHQIRVYSGKKIQRVFGAGELVNPVGIALDQANQIVYVSDHGDPMSGTQAAVYSFTYEGTPLDIFASSDFGFDRPRGIAYELGRLYITDALSGVVIVVDIDSRVKVGDLGSYGSDLGQLIQPQDICMYPGETEAFVANKRLGRIERILTGGL